MVLMLGSTHCCVFVSWQAGFHVLILAIGVLVWSMLRLNVVITVAVLNTVLLKTVRVLIAGVSRTKDSMFVERNWRDIVGVIVAMIKNVTFVMLSTTVCCVFVCWLARLVVLIIAIGVLIGSLFVCIVVCSIAIRLLF